MLRSQVLMLLVYGVLTELYLCLKAPAISARRDVIKAVNTNNPACSPLKLFILKEANKTNASPSISVETCVVT